MWPTAMLFTTFQFTVFFCIALTVYWALKQHRLRMGWLLIASVVFYMSWNPWLILLILFSAGTDFLAAHALERTGVPGLRRALLVGSIGVNLSLLAYFKYVNFFLGSAGWLLQTWGLGGSLPVLDVVLPLGTSFYTFETISYMVDVYRGRAKAVRDPLHYALFILFFPHLIAGPIV